MDPEAVIDEAQGSIDEALLTRTRGGFLGRNVLADVPLLKRLDDAETLHYLLSSPAPPTKIEDGEGTELDTTGSYRTLLAVTDARLLLVAGSADGDRAISLPYDAVVAVDHRLGLLTTAVVVETATGVGWSLSVGGGSDAADAVAYADGRLPDDASERAGEAGASGQQPAAAPDATEEASRTLESILDDADAFASEDLDRLTDVSTGAEAAGTTAADGHEGRSMQQNGTQGADPNAKRPAVDPPETPPPEPPEESGAVAVLFEAVVGDREASGVEGYGDGTLSALVDGVASHREQLRRHLEAGEVDAATDAATAVDALAAAALERADASGDTDIVRRVTDARRRARRRLVRGVFDVDELDGGAVSGVKHVLQGADGEALVGLVADLWGRLGFQTAVTTTDEERGVDVVARQSTPVEQTVVIQVKPYAPTVGPEAVQQFAGLDGQAGDADLLVLVTTGAFTAAARETAADRDVKPVDGKRLTGLVIERECLDLVVRHAGRAPATRT